MISCISIFSHFKKLYKSSRAKEVVISFLLLKMYAPNTKTDATTTETPNKQTSSTLHGIKEAIVDLKDNVKETLQRDHHHGQDCAKKPQDGKTNPME